MIRAGVFIGVDKTGDLQRLNDAAAGARRMHGWALDQGMTDLTHAKLITDADGQMVAPERIYDAIKELIDGPGVDQLVLYFAGHGVNINRGEQWLLTEAPVRASAAVNVAGSVELARYCGIQHVVVISDACRTAPEGIQAQNVRGVDVFPNEAASDRAKPVDQFFACFLGRTAAELKDPAVVAGNYTALYTSALLEALSGAHPDVLERATTPGDSSRYIRPRRLQRYLEQEIPRRVRAMRLQQKVNQNPDAIITSDESWLSRVEAPAEPRGRPVPAPEAHPPASPSLRSVTGRLVRSAVAGDPAVLDRELAQARTAPVAGAEQLARTVDRIAMPFGPGRVETQCGIKVRGARIVDFHTRRGTAGRPTLEDDLLRVETPDHRAVNVLLVLDGGVGTVIPAIPEFLAALTFDDGELVDVAYEPSVDSWRWEIFKERSAEVRALRAVASTSSQHGRFRLEPADAPKLARRMQYAKGIDPTLAIYSAYAYHDLQDVERIRDMSGYLRDDIGVTFFDLALLGRTLIDRSIGPDDGIVPFVPLLSQGWALLGANRVRLHPALAGIETTMRDSLWTLFDTSGVGKLANAMRTGEV